MADVSAGTESTAGSQPRSSGLPPKPKETGRMRNTKYSELGGALRRTKSLGPMRFLSRGRSSRRQDSEIKPSDSKSHRSRSRRGKGILKKIRSLSFIGKSSQDTEPSKNTTTDVAPSTKE